MCELPQSTPQLLFRSGSAAPPTLPSFPTRRSSDLDHLRDRIHAGAVELAGRERLLVGAVDLILDEERAVFPHIGERRQRSEEHTSELQSHSDLVCRLLLEKKKQRPPHCTG